MLLTKLNFSSFRVPPLQNNSLALFYLIHRNQFVKHSPNEFDQRPNTKQKKAEMRMKETDNNATIANRTKTSYIYLRCVDGLLVYFILISYLTNIWLQFIWSKKKNEKRDKIKNGNLGIYFGRNEKLLREWYSHCKWYLLNILVRWNYIINRYDLINKRNVYITIVVEWEQVLNLSYYYWKNTIMPLLFRMKCIVYLCSFLPFSYLVEEANSLNLIGRY